MPKAKKTNQLLQFFDNHILLFLAALLLVFIPLYPKIPLWSPIEEYIVRVRLEDLLIAIAVPITLIQILRKKARFEPVIIKLFAAYALVGLLSVLSAVFITKTVPLELLHLGKTMLHYFRYLEYFSVFLVTFAAIKNRRDLVKLLVIILTTLAAIFIYGYMQKFFYWPVWSTMNREFSKGIKLYLTEHARIQSTFAGHYDLAAYLVIILPVIFSLGLTLKKYYKWLAYIIFFCGSWLMVMSASRIPFFAYIVACGVVILLVGWFKKTWRDRALSWLTHSLGYGLMLFFLLYYFGQGMLDRLSNVLSTSDRPVNLSEVLDETLEGLPIPNSDELYAWLPKLDGVPASSQPAPTENDNLLAQVSAPSDQPPTTVNPANRPRDVYEDIPEPVETEVTLPDGSKETVVLHQPRTFSECALKYELSLCIRLESLWPWAIQSFQHNPVLGTGYATLNKQFVNEFTFADGTDNNYLRTLGETGILGFLSFYGIIIYILYSSVRMLSKLKNPLALAVVLGFTAGSIGILINALYIDVFAASKVAYTYWLMAGIIMAIKHNELQTTA